jgi:hypothetical protein
MGLFDFFKRKSTPEPAPALPDMQPRCPHYTFAHQALRSVALADPLPCLGLLASADAGRFLAGLLESVSEHCAALGEKADFTADDIRVHPTRVGSYPCAVVQMPPPRAITEAFFVALVLLAAPEDPPERPEDARLRYFTLEKGFSLDGSERTVLCEWTETRHVNYGDGPAPHVEAFVAAVSELLGRDA